LSKDLFSMLLGRYLFQSVFIDQAILSEFKGIDFRGAFGPALKKVVCALKQADCSGCSLSRRCLYPLVFGGAEHKDRRAPLTARSRPARSVARPPGRPLTILVRQDQERAREARDRLATSPHPCVIEPPESAQTRFHPREAFAFELLLFGKANNSIPYFVQAFRQMGRMGVGRSVEGRRGRFLLQTVRAGERVLYAGEGQPILDEAATVDLRKRLLYDLATTPADLSGSLTVRLRTPLKLKSGHPEALSLPFDALLRETLQRVASLCHAFGNGEPALDYRSLAERATRVRTLAQALEAVEPADGTNRRDREWLGGGLTGEVRYGDGWAEFFPLLRFAEQVHLGESTTFGLGRIELVRSA